MRQSSIVIMSRDYWFKIVEMLQQNWALVDTQEDGACIVLFIHDGSGVFDQITLSSRQEAEKQLRKNGFRRYAEDIRAQGLLSPPLPPFYEDSHPNGLIYSSGRYWK